MKKPKRMADDFRLQAILIHSHPSRTSEDSKLPPGFKAGMRALSQTLPGKKRDKDKDAWEAESNWRRNMSFLAGVYALIPSGDAVLKLEAEKLLLKMFGKGFSKNRVERFGPPAERRRIRKDGEAAWRLVKKLRKRFGLSD